MCLFHSFLSRYACSLSLYPDVLVTLLSIKMCLFSSFLSRCACYLPFYQNVLVHLDRKEENKHILIESKVTSHLDRKEGGKHILIERKVTKMCLFPSFLSRCSFSLPFYQDVLVLFLSIKICLFTSFLTICACSIPFYQDMLVPFLHLDRKEGNKHILIERKRTSTS
jgi:hypothetical protein